MRRNEEERCVFIVSPVSWEEIHLLLIPPEMLFKIEEQERQKKSGRSDWPLIFQIDQHVKRIKVGLVPETLITSLKRVREG